MNSPYEEPWRLQDIIAAIQVMGAHEYDKLTVEKWTDHKLPKKPKSATNWGEVFSDHPEFFIINEEDGRTSLTWRRAYYPYFDVDERRERKASEYRTLSSDHQKKLSRKPLEPDQIQALISTAISLHASTLAQHEEHRARNEEFRAAAAELRAEGDALRAAHKELREQKQAALWWIPVFAALLAFIGSILGAILKK